MCEDIASILEYLGEVSLRNNDIREGLEKMLGGRRAMPEFSDIEKKKTIVLEYSKAITEFDNVSEYTSWVSLQVYTLKVLRSMLSDMAVPESVREKTRRGIDRVVGECSELKQAIEGYRLAVESRTRFWASLQYQSGALRGGGF